MVNFDKFFSRQFVKENKQKNTMIKAIKTLQQQQQHYSI